MPSEENRAGCRDLTHISRVCNDSFLILIYLIVLRAVTYIHECKITGVFISILVSIHASIDDTPLEKVHVLLNDESDKNSI
jgi:hypothetical protein